MYFKGCIKYIIGFATVSLIEAFLSIALPLISARIILNITDDDMNGVLIAALLLAIVNIIFFMCNWFKSNFYQKIARSVEIKIQSTVAQEAIRWSW